MAAASPFTAKTLTFLRALARNNDREWFRAHADEYESHVKGPMRLAIARIGEEFRVLAPELMADPKKSLYRIWRDTRFSADKRPLKTNVAAVFPHRLGTRHSSAGLYFEIAPKWVFAGGGIYMPEPWRPREDPPAHRHRAAEIPAPGDRRAAAGRRRHPGRSPHPRAARISRRSPSRGISTSEALPGESRVAARVRHEQELLAGTARDVSRDHAAGTVSERDDWRW